jgi:hypothetical protein
MMPVVDLPAGALTVGLGAGTISTLGFAFLTPFLERTIGLGDTCAVRRASRRPAACARLHAKHAQRHNQRQQCTCRCSVLS